MKKLILLVAIVTILSSCDDPITYTVKVTFCDSRAPDTVTVQRIHPLDNRDIQTYKLAVPEWNGYLNVCDLKVLSKK